jgi:hypothetical protein
MGWRTWPEAIKRHEGRRRGPLENCTTISSQKALEQDAARKVPRRSFSFGSKDECEIIRCRSKVVNAGSKRVERRRQGFCLPG